jgi:hypothetical protein
VGAGAVNTAFAFLVFAALEATWGRVVNYMIILLLAHVIGVLEAFLVYRLTVLRVGISARLGDQRGPTSVVG